MPREKKKPKREKVERTEKTVINATTKRQITKGLKLTPKTENQAIFMEFLNDPDKLLTFATGAPGSGKSFIAVVWALMNLDRFEKIIYIRPNVVSKGEDALGALPGCQPLHSKVLTPSGWRLMGDLKIGDKVVAHDGSHVDILGIFPKGVKKTYEIVTTEGQKTITCGDHLWFTKTTNDFKHGKHGSIKSTLQIKDSLRDNTFKNQLNHSIPRASKVEFDFNSNLPINPYLLGVLLGDGSISSGAISFSSIDSDIIDRVSNIVIQDNCRIAKTNNTIQYNITSDCFANKPAKSVKITNVSDNTFEVFESIGLALKTRNINRSTLHRRCSNGSIIEGVKYEFIDDAPESNHPIKQNLISLNLFGKTALDKFIPEIYKLSSIEDRVELLRGLMDTDGTIKKSNGECSYTTISVKLAQDICELVRSLGGRSTIYTRDRVGKTTQLGEKTITTQHISYEVTISLKDINPFYLQRKSSSWVSNRITHRTKIESITEVGEEAVQCILIDHPDHLYITDDYIVTHNTEQEKLHWLRLPIYDILDGFINENNIDRLFEAGVIEISNVGRLRGRSLASSVIILDEAQNLDSHLLRTALTRIGQDSKLIVCGDENQSDLRDVSKSALTTFSTKLDVLEEVGVVKFTKIDCVRNPLITKILNIIGE